MPESLGQSRGGLQGKDGPLEVLQRAEIAGRPQPCVFNHGLEAAPGRHGISSNTAESPADTVLEAIS